MQSDSLREDTSPESQREDTDPHREDTSPVTLVVTETVLFCTCLFPNVLHCIFFGVVL